MWYNEFKTNLELMLEQNINCSITCCIFDSISDVCKIVEKYPTDESIDRIFNSNAYIYSYNLNNDFNVCLCINNKINKQKIEEIKQKMKNIKEKITGDKTEKVKLVI